MIYPVGPAWLRRLTEAWSRIAGEEAARMPAATAAARRRRAAGGFDGGFEGADLGGEGGEEGGGGGGLVLAGAGLLPARRRRLRVGYTTSDLRAAHPVGDGLECAVRTGRGMGRGGDRLECAGRAAGGGDKVQPVCWSVDRLGGVDAAWPQAWPLYSNPRGYT